MRKGGGSGGKAPTRKATRSFSRNKAQRSVAGAGQLEQRVSPRDKARAKGEMTTREAMRQETPARPAPKRAAPSQKAPSPRIAEAPRTPTRSEQKAATSEALVSGVQHLTVTADEAGMRIDRFLEHRFPQLSFSHIQRIARKGELRVNGKRVETKDRLEEGQDVRMPPVRLDPAAPRPARAADDAANFLKDITLYEDADVMVIDKPAGLAVQGGSGTTRHVDGLLMSMADPDGQRPRLVHRLDKETSGCLVIAKTRLAASVLAKSFRSRSARKVYWALVAGVPRVRQGRVSTYLAKEENERESRMAISQHGGDGAMHAVTFYAVVETSAQKLAWLSLKPVTGRTHQLRAHTAHIGHPIIGDEKYFNVENWQLPGGIQNRLHLLARRIVIPHPRGKGVIDVTAPLPAHMRQSWNLLGFDDTRYDPIVDAPDD
jgi:23S rRNA pseudouridine955/2504/2580 synthase